jgi:hypothetical protein
MRCALQYEIEGFLANGVATFHVMFGTRKGMYGMKRAPMSELQARTTRILSNRSDCLRA